ncbi:MFS general substrate transporter [Aspergillus bertholletiae]|uniref:MFS general substrate transporter n=1 Tax=Aspergillus bertholletiae TaxID=1226010 RepID=A0A5N7B9Q6_9EURO|nr:MFS general substrate transporter [Aspergillus bertholletiae]
MANKDSIKRSSGDGQSPPSGVHSIFDKRQKALIVLLVSTAATFSTLASNIYFPAILTISHDLGVSVQLVNLTITSYLIFQGITPSLWGPVSDVKGRRTAYACTFVVSVGACIGLAESKNYATLVILRCLQSAGSASTIAIGSGVIGDITTRADRGSYMGFFQGGFIVPIAVGPVIGGALAGTLGWKSIFWFLTIYSIVILLLLLLLLPETLRSIVGNGGLLPEKNKLAQYPLNLYQRFTQVKWDPEAAPTQLGPRKRIDILGPLRILTKRYAAPIILFFAIYFAIWQMSITAMSTLFKSRYGLTEIQTGLTFLANGIGSIIGTVITGKILDMDYRRMQAKHTVQSEHDFPLEKARLRLLPVFLLLQCVSILMFGWTIHCSVHIAAPIVSTFVTGWTSVSAQSIVTTYLVDIFPDQSAAATASLNLARCLCAAGGASFVIPLVNRVGAGVAFTICVAVQLAAAGGLVVQWVYAGGWRRQASENMSF